MLPLTDKIYRRLRGQKRDVQVIGKAGLGVAHVYCSLRSISSSPITRCLLAFTLSPSPIAGWGMLVSDAVILHFWDQFEAIEF